MASENFETKQDSDPKDTVTVLGGKWGVCVCVCTSA